MRSIEIDLRRVFSRALDSLTDEVLNALSLRKVYPQIGALNPAEMYETHVQHLLFAGLRLAGYYTQAETGYFAQAKRRRLHLGVWLSDHRRWVFIEIERCPTQAGYKSVLWDATKLLQDRSNARRDNVRGLLVYGFKERLKRDSEHFRNKFERMTTDIESLGDHLIAKDERSLQARDFPLLIMGLWLAKKPIGGWGRGPKG
jgi:hypothetical protein